MYQNRKGTSKNRVEMESQGSQAGREKSEYNWDYILGKI